MIACVSYSVIGADCCIYGACPFWSHVTLRCEYNLHTEDEMAMMMAPERKKMSELEYDELEGPECPLCGSIKTKDDPALYGYHVCLDCRARFTP